MFSKTLGLVQVFIGSHVILYSASVGIEFQQKHYDKLAISVTLAVLHLLTLIHLLIAERSREVKNTKDKL